LEFKYVCFVVWPPDKIAWIKNANPFIGIFSYLMIHELEVLKNVSGSYLQQPQFIGMKSVIELSP
jgi:hypothetical protein